MARASQACRRIAARSRTAGGGAAGAWDLVCDLRNGVRLTADGEPLKLDGRFVGR